MKQGTKICVQWRCNRLSDETWKTAMENSPGTRPCHSYAALLFYVLIDGLVTSKMVHVTLCHWRIYDLAEEDSLTKTEKEGCPIRVVQTRW